MLRAYAVASRDRYTVMPGALARVARSADNPEVSMQVGAGSKDTWVLSSGQASSFSLLPPASHAVELSRGGGDLPSRVADNLYWLGRYAERAEGIARLARVTMARLQDAPSEPGLWQSSGFRMLASVLGGPDRSGDGRQRRPRAPVEVAARSPRSSSWRRSTTAARAAWRRSSRRCCGWRARCAIGSRPTPGGC